MSVREPQIGELGARAGCGPHGTSGHLSSRIGHNTGEILFPWTLAACLSSSVLNNLTLSESGAVAEVNESLLSV